MTNKTNCKLPPYSKPLYELIKSGYMPKVFVFVYIGVLAWQRAKRFAGKCPTTTIVLPFAENPFNFTYPVFECDVIIIDVGFSEDEYIDDLAFCLLKEGAASVRYSSPEYKLTVFTRNSIHE